MPDNEAILKVDTHAVNEGRDTSDSNGGFESHGLVANSPAYEYVTDSQPNTTTDVIDTTTGATAKEEVTKSDDQLTLTTPINKGPSIQENQAYDPDDGAWETVEVKPRGKRKKGGSKTASPVAAQQHNNTKSSTNSTNANNANGQNNSDAASVHNGRGGGGGARRPRRVRGDKNRNSSNNNNHQSNTIHHQQHNKLVKDVILHILDAVDVEIRAKSSEGNRSTKSNGNSNRHLSSHVVSNGGYRRHQSNGDVESSSPKHSPLPSMVSNSSAKSLRDIVVGTSTVATKGGIHTEQPSNGSSRVKPGMSYKSVIEPAAAVNKTQPPSPPPPPPQPQPPAPKPNAWSKPPSDMKLKQNDEPKKIAEEKLVAVRSMSEKPNQHNSRLVGSSVIDEVKEKPLSSTSGNNVEAEHRHSVSTVDDDGSPPPLATLLGPGTSYSASSSVASSLEAPHSSANRFRHQSSSNNTEDDVGYHLLNVCGQLSEEINTFMSRRALALDIRRKERNAVLNALGDTLGVSHIISFSFVLEYILCCY